MTTILIAALNERELLLLDKENCEEILSDCSLPELNRAAADLRIATIEQAINMIDGIIALHLERMPITDFIEFLNTNLSDQCN